MRLFKALIFGTLFIAAMLFSYGNSADQETQETQTKTIYRPDTITLAQNMFAGNPILLAPYKSMNIFESAEESADFDFTTVGGAWEEITPSGTSVQAEVRFKVDGQWTDWLIIDGEPDALKPLLEDGVESKAATASSNPAQAFQYRYILYGNGTETPIVKNSEWTFIHAGTSPVKNLEPTPKPKYASSFNSPELKLLSMISTPDGVISRSAWGADESKRYLVDNSQTADLIEIDSEFYKKYADELQYSRVVEADEKGNKYKWPLQYPDKVQKFVVHHTATTGNLDNPAQAIRDIYQYHAVTRGWGDIGYNYIIDPKGAVYEGRYGGEGVIGAHAGPGNNGSIGIAILGNYDTDPVPETVFVSLGKLINNKALIHGIDAQGNSMFRGKNMANIFGHRDIMSTTCPGKYLYEKLDVIKGLAIQNLQLKEKFVKKFDFQNTSDIYYLDLKPTESSDVTITMENIGTETWGPETYLSMVPINDLGKTINLPTKKDSQLAPMEENSVEPGGTATFKFRVEALKTGGTSYLQMTPLINRIEYIDEHVVLPVNVQQPIYKYQIVYTVFPQSLMKAGSTVDGSIELKNLGNMTWENTGTSAFVLNYSNGKATLENGPIEPGKIGKFKYQYTSPSTAGFYQETFTPKLDNVAWQSAEKLTFSTTVYEREIDSSLISKTPLTQLEKDKQQTLSVTLRNLGIEDWKESDLKVIFHKKSELKIKALELNPKTVQPGETGTISFIVQSTGDLGESIFYLRPLMRNEKLNKQPFHFQFTVVDKQTSPSSPVQNNPDPVNSPSNDPDSSTQSSKGDDIRIKLSFSGEPEITAAGNFDVYNDDDLISSLSSGQSVSVSKEGTKLRINANGVNFLKDGVVRMIPKNSAIMEIKNFEHRPSWNQSLNDNKYHGLIEVRLVDGNITTINELPLEDYLKGLGEVSDSEPSEKVKAIMVAARSYAKFYMTKDQKFPGKPYHLDDDPNVSQKYLGYGFELRAPKVAAAVKATAGQVISYNGELVKAPFFSQSDGKMTKSAKDVWGWTTTPYLISVDDSFCSGDKFLGHGVGMSGCGAKGMAEKGYTYVEILKHYYTGIEVGEL